MLPADHVRLAHRLFLGRDPRPDEVAQRRVTAKSLRGLMDDLLGSEQYGAKTGPDDGRFRPYVLPDRRVGGHCFDFLIANRLGHAWYSGIVELRSPEVDWCMAHIAPGMTVLDCGAHHGLMSVAFAKAAGPRGRMLAWEAWPAAALVAEWNLVINGCDNASVRACALGGSPGKVSFQVIEETALTSAANADLPQVEIETVTLDDELSDNARVDFIKIDVEGCELEVLRGARRIVAQRPILDLELHNSLFADRDRTMGEILQILAPLNYRYWLQPVGDAEVHPLSQSFQLAELRQWDNPHLFCLP